MKTAALFDLDGTLVFQTRAYRERTVGKTVRELGLTCDENFVDYFWYGNGDRDKLIEKSLGIDYMSFWRVFWKNDSPEERVKHTGVYDDVTALKELKERGVKLGIVTGSLSKVADAEISKVLSKIQGCSIDSIISNDGCMRQKPYPDSLLTCIKELNVQSADAVYVGNAREDVKAARAARIKPVVILREPIGRVNYGSSVEVINSLHEVANII